VILVPFPSSRSGAFLDKLEGVETGFNATTALDKAIPQYGTCFNATLYQSIRTPHFVWESTNDDVLSDEARDHVH
jgi:hypothetical protein